MTATNHVIAGALVATYVHNPWVALPVAFASHFVFDAIPHFGIPGTKHDDLKFFLMLATDMALAASILVALLVLHPANVYLIVACGIAAASPDLMWLYYLIIRKGENKHRWPRLVRFHSDIQTERPWLILVELVWFVFGGALLASRLY